MTSQFVEPIDLAWTISSGDEFPLRRIFGTIQCKDGIWRSRINDDEQREIAVERGFGVLLRVNRGAVLTSRDSLEV